MVGSAHSRNGCTSSAPAGGVGARSVRTSARAEIHAGAKEIRISSKVPSRPERLASILDSLAWLLQREYEQRAAFGCRSRHLLADFAEECRKCGCSANDNGNIL